VFGVTDSVRFRIESSEARLPHYRRLDIGVQRDFSRWGMEGTFAFNLINATWRTNPVELDWSGYFCSRDPACRTRKIARRAGLPIIPTIGLSVRW
jgi:hypothetical protein